jgi:HlyD family secretion protein
MARRLLRVRAPSAGTVTQVLSIVGASVDTTTPIMSVADLDRLAVSINLSEFDAARVRSGQKAEVSIDALGGVAFPGRVIYASPTGVEQNGLVYFPVQIALDEDKKLRPGMNASVRIVVAQKRDAVQVPVEAVTEDGDAQVVTVLNAAGEPEVRTVETGLDNTKNIEILKGLEEGDRVQIQLPPEEE